MTKTEIINAATLGIEGGNASRDDIFHVNEIPSLLAVFEDARAVPAFHLFRQMVNHARRHPFVRLARAVNVEITQSDDDPIAIFSGSPRRQIVHNCLGKGVDICRCSAIRFHTRLCRSPIGRRR